MTHVRSVAILAATAALATAGAASADNFYFSFTNDVGNVSGTVTGEIFGLVNNSTGPATKVEILSYPSGVLGPSPSPAEVAFYATPIDALTWATQFENSFTETAGVVTFADFHADNSTPYSTLDRLYLNGQNCSSGPTCSFLSLGTNDGYFVWHGDAGTTFTPATGVPEPAGWALMLVGIGLAGAALRSRNALA